MNLKSKGTGQTSQPKMAILFYVFSAILFICFILQVYNITVYIQSVIAQGSITVAANWLDIIIYYITNTISYFAYSAVLLGIGLLLKGLKKQPLQVTEANSVVVETPIETIEDETNDIEDLTNLVEE